MSDFDLFLKVRSDYMKELSETPPLAISVEPRGACSLACKFCYVKDKTTQEVSVSKVAEVLLAYPSVQVLYVYGGDFCDRHEWAAELLDLADARGLEVRISTGGARLDAALAKRINRSRVRVQLSLEPPEWRRRIDHAGRPSIDVVEDHAAIKRLTVPVRVNTVIPTSVEVPAVSLASYLDRLCQVFGHSNFSASYAAEGTESGQLPEWWSDWLVEADSLAGCASGRYAGKLPLSHFYPDFSAGAVLVGCGATQTPTLGPDGNLYSCHSKAVDMDPAWKLDQRSANVSTWAGLMDNKDCRACPAKFACGGICYLRSVGKHNPQCQFMVANYRRWAETPAAKKQLLEAAEKRLTWTQTHELEPDCS